MHRVKYSLERLPDLKTGRIKKRREDIMGWWTIENQNDKTGEITGDEVLDVAHEAVEKIAKIYQSSWGRLPTQNELRVTFNSCCLDVFK